MRALLNIWTVAGSIGQDLRYGWRELAAGKLWTAVAALSLGIGLGAASGVFGILLPFIESLPVAHPEELVAFRYDRITDRANSVLTSRLVWEEMYTANRTLSSMFAFTLVSNCGTRLICADSANIEAGGQLDWGSVQYVSGEFFKGLGVEATRGRTITPDDDDASAAPVAVLSHRFWQTRFRKAPEAIGATMRVDKLQVDVVGVLPERMKNPAGAGAPMPDIILPLAFHHTEFDVLQRSRSLVPEGIIPIALDMAIMGRRKPGLTIAQVEGNFGTVAEETLAREYAAAVSTMSTKPPVIQTQFPRAMAVSGNRGVYDNKPGTMRNIQFLAVVSGILLFIVCLNVANLLLARAAVRQKDTALRAILGASGGRLIRQVLVESVILAGAGAVCGVALSGWPKLLFRLMAAYGVGSPQTFPSTLDPRLIAFEFVLAVVAALAFGIGPAVSAMRSLDWGRRAGQYRSFGGRHSRFARVLVISQVALSLALLVVAQLLLGNLRNIRAVDLGFNPSDVALVTIRSPEEYNPQRLIRLYEQILAEVRKVPGVRAAAFSNLPILTAGVVEAPLPVFADNNKIKQATTAFRVVHPDFFRTLGIPLKSGNLFTAADNSPSQLAVIVNQAFVRDFLANPNAVGTHIRIGRDRQPAVILGVVGDVKGDNLKAPAPSMVFSKYQQMPFTRVAAFEIRVSGRVDTFFPAVRAAVRRIDSDLALNSMTSYKAATELRLMGDQLLLTPLMRVMGGLALIVSMIGLFSLMSYTVARRTREIGIRMAIGAQPVTILFAVLKEIQGLVWTGVAGGIAFALALTPVIEAQWFGLGPHDPKTIAAVSLLTVAVSCIAGYLPARRASQVDPLVSLRYDGSV
jgi:predicted permease